MIVWNLRAVDDLFGEPATGNVHHVKWACRCRQPRLELRLHRPLDDLLDQIDGDDRSTVGLFVEDNNDPAWIGDDEGALPVLVRRQDLHGVDDDGPDVFLRRTTSPRRRGLRWAWSLACRHLVMCAISTLSTAECSPSFL